MARAMSAWLTAGRLRGRRRLRMDWPERRRELVSSLAPGKSFIDVGGMWNMHGEMVFRAEDAGAERIVLFDAMDPTEEYRREHERRGSRVEYVQGDLHDLATVESLGEFDVVWCTGVIYHTPNPYEQVRHLRRICHGELMLGSQVIPEVPGIDQACIWYPGLPDGARESFRRAHGGDGAPRCIGVTEPFDPALGYANYWWGISPSAMRAMVEAAGFDVFEELPWTTWVHDVRARPRAGEIAV
jgi:hypothetical protein